MKGSIEAVFGNMVTARFEGVVTQNAVAYCLRCDGARLKAEVIRVRGARADLQVFEETRGLKVGDGVEFTDELLSAVLGPGLLGMVYDGLQNPLVKVAEQAGYFLRPGLYCEPLDAERRWDFTPTAAAGQSVEAGDELGAVPEGIFRHRIMVPAQLRGTWTVERIAAAGARTVSEEIAMLVSGDGRKETVTMTQRWPVKTPFNPSSQRLYPDKPLITNQRIIDTFFPIVQGGCYCIPGPFGAGKTVLQQLTSRYAEVDVVVIAACGERAGEVVETLREFPHLSDPRTGRTLMERTVIICNTSAMPVAAREASVYTATVIGEYYRQMGLNVLLLADSTSRWAQAMREMSGRLEEIPGEEAFPAYLESRIAAFYERAGLLQFKDGSTGSLTIGGSVSPAGGNFQEPVTQATLKVVGAFHGLSRARSDARKFPSIDPLDSWSRYPGIIDAARVKRAREFLHRGAAVLQMMAVVGEEGTSMEDFVVALKGDFLDSVYLQQNGFDKVDCATSSQRQQYVFDRVLGVLDAELRFPDKDTARKAFFRLTDLFRNWNYLSFGGPEFSAHERQIEEALAGLGAGEEAKK